MLFHALVEGVERSLTPNDFEDWVREGRIDAETPVRIGDASPVAAYSLPAFAAVHQSAGAAIRQAWQKPVLPWATFVLAGLCVRQALWGAPMHLALSRSSPDIVYGGEGWRLLTYSFVHAGLEHIAFNLALILLLGVALERLFGSVAVLGLWMFSAVIGGALAGIMSPEQPSVGSSGVDFGMLGMAIVVGWRWFDLIPRNEQLRFGGGIVAFAAYQLYIGAFAARTDNWCHFGGLLAGLTYGIVARPGGNNRLLAAAGVFGAAAAMALSAGLSWRVVPFEEAVSDGLRAERPTWWTVGWTEVGGTGWAERSADGTLIAAMGMVTERRGTPMSVQAWAQDVMDRYQATDSAAVITPTPSTDPALCEAFQISWRKADQPLQSVVQACVRGRYAHAFSVDARPGLESLTERLIAGFVLVEPDAVRDAPTGPSLRARTLRARALIEAGRGDEARGLFDASLPEEAQTLVGLPSW